MKSELRKRLVKRILSETLSRMRLYGNLEEREFAERISDFPRLLREWASQLEDPSKDLIRSELPGFEAYSRWAKVYDNDLKSNPVIAGYSLHGLSPNPHESSKPISEILSLLTIQTSFIDSLT